MPAVHSRLHRLRLGLLFTSAYILFFSALTCRASASPVAHNNNKRGLLLDYSPAPPPEEGPPLSANALRDPSNLPWQLGCIAGAYGVSLALVVILIVILSKNRRAALRNGADEADFPQEIKPLPPVFNLEPPLSPRSIPRSPVRNFSYKSPLQTEFFAEQTEYYPNPSPYVNPSPASTVKLPGVDGEVDQGVVANDRAMAQSQLEEMFKYVMEQEEAKKQGIILQGTPVLSTQSRPSTSDRSTTTLKKEKAKPAGLDLSRDREDRTQSKTPSFFSALRSPRSKKGSSMRGMSISSPMMTPASENFPKQESQEMERIPPRQYQPPPPPPVPTDQLPFRQERQSQRSTRQLAPAPLTPNDSPESTMSIDERIGSQLPVSHSRKSSMAPSDHEPVSASTERSHTPLIGLPSSPKPNVTRFPTLPASPKPGATFQRKAPPSAVRTGGALPFRAYESSMASPKLQTQETTFERSYPLSPMTARTPGTAMAVPYTPYQPFTPCVPMTPSLVTKADRKRMRRLEPKTPTMEMVESTDDVW